MRALLTILSFVAVLARVTHSANILFYFGVSTYSHRNAVWPLVVSLANSGHHVTFVNIYAPKPEHVHPNVTEFFPRGDSPPLFGDPVNARIKDGWWGGFSVAAAKLPEVGYEVCRDFLSSPETGAWIARSKFDLVFIDALFNDCGYGLAHVFGAKTIVFGPTTVFSWWHDSFGFPAENSWISDMIIPFRFPMAFGQRLFSALMPLTQYAIRYWDFYPRMDRLLAEKLNMTGGGMPSLLQLERQTALIMVSTYFAEEFARSLPPFLVPIGGIHMETPLGQGEQALKPVPKDLARWIEESGSAGFIYVSFGSSSALSAAPESVRQKFYRAFKNSGQRILLKWETDNRPADMPPNVYTAKWMPQQTILTHPNVKAFVTHAGLMGLTESLSQGVPVLMFPIFAEQDYNAFRYEREGRGISMELSTFTAEELEHALREIVDNPKYKRNMLRAKKLYSDRPLSPLHTALWWTDYVLRHDHAELQSLKPLSIGQWWWQRRLLDVWVVLGAIAAILAYVAWWVLKIVYKFAKWVRGAAHSGTTTEKVVKIKSS